MFEKLGHVDDSTGDPTMILRSFAIVTALIVTAVEPITGSGDVDLIHYAITQGGLLAVVIVLLWNYRRDMHRIRLEEQARNDAHIARIDSHTKMLAERHGVFERLLTDTAVAMTRQAESSERVALALQNLERRHR
jgi:hypothetical protein